MRQEIPLPLVRQIGARRDYYAELMEGSRWLRQEQAAARTEWFERLEREDKVELLFELEMLLKGIVCFGNPVNHPGSPKRAEPVAAREFRSELGVAKEIISRIVEAGGALAEKEERALVFQRYLESVIAQDEARFQMVKQSLAQDTPQQSLNLLISFFRNLLDVILGFEDAPHVTFRVFSSTIQLAQREIHRSVFFDPLAALEFRSEIDRIRSPKLTDLVRDIESDPARRVTTLTLLALFRLLAYVARIEAICREGKRMATLFGWLAVLRSDTRALTIFSKRDSTVWIADGFGRQYENLDPLSVRERFPRLVSQFGILSSLRELLASLADQLRLEQRRVFEQQLPAISEMESLEQFGAAAAAAVRPLKGFLQNAVILIAREFDPAMDGAAVFSDFVPAAAQSDRLRRDIWMFQQILRAFIEKAKTSAEAADEWTATDTFRFVRQFVSYFRSMGYQLLRYSDYERFDKFIQLVDRLREGDVLEVQRLSGVVASCMDFQKFLEQTFEAVSHREELKDLPFDRKEAARTLKLFLKR